MPKAVQLTAYGGIDQLHVVDVPKPEARENDVVVRVVAAGTNPGETNIRTGMLKDMYPHAFPFGQGTDFSGRVDSVDSGVHAFAEGDEVFGWTDERAAQAEYVRVPAHQVVKKPPSLDWYRAGSLFVAGTTAVAAVRAVSVRRGDTVAVSAAAGGVGSLAVQLARRAGARVIGIASEESSDFLQSVGVVPVAYGDGLEDRVRQAAGQGGVDAFLDFFGGYIETALALGVEPQRINTTIDFAGAKKHGTKADGGAQAATPDTLRELGDLIAWGEIVMPLSAIYPFAQVKDAYTELERRKTRGKIVLALDLPMDQVLQPAKTSRRVVP